MKKVLKFVKGRKDDKKDGGITPSSSGDLLSPAQTPEDERFLGLDNATGYIVDFCGKDKSLTKLHKAAWQGNLEKVKNALKKIDIDAVDRHNRAALHFAVVQGHPNIVWFLLGNNASHYICDDEGRTALVKAVECGHKECMNLLLERGANINHADFSGSTALHLVINQGAIEIASILLQKGADVEVANNFGEYPLHIAIRKQNKDMVELLLRNGASVNAVDRDNRTPLMLAAKTGNISFAQLFFEYGAQLTVVDSNGWTAEDYALLGGHQNVAIEIKNFIKKDSKPALETYAEEDEGEIAKSDADTWNDSHLSDAVEEKTITGKVGQFMRKYSVESDGGVKSEKDDDMIDSPGTGVVPPPCQPPRSWEIIEAGMIDEAVANGAEPKRRSITALGSLLSRRESFTDTSGSQTDGPKYTLSLNRRKNSKKNTDVTQRFSFNEEDSLKSYLSDDFGSGGKNEKDEAQNIMRKKRKEQRERRSKSSSGSDWDSNLASLLETESGQPRKKEVTNTAVGVNQEDLNDNGTLGRRETMNEVEEIWVSNPQTSVKEPPVPQLPPKVEEETEVSSSWDSADSFQNETGFPPPPTAFELGVDMAKSISYMKGISIDHTPGFSENECEWRPCYGGQSHSLDCLDEKDSADADLVSDKSTSSKRHTRQPSISNQKWRSVELPSQQRPPNRLSDVNRRINEQLECYDQALRELAECTYSRKQDAIISSLTSAKPSQVNNYYSLPSVKCKSDMFFNSKTSQSPVDFGMSLPLQFSKTVEYFANANNSRNFEANNGPTSLPYSANTVLESLQKFEEVENNEKLGLEVNDSQKGKPVADEEGENGKSDKKTKRHMLLTMRDVKHAVQVTNSFKSSLDEQILSPLTQLDGKFNLSANTTNQMPSDSDEASAGEEPAFFGGDTVGLLGRQETVIERSEFRVKSSSSESGEEPTLWLQEKAAKCGESAATTDDEGHGEKGERDFSPLGAVYRELQAERLNKGYETSSEVNLTPSRESPVEALKRLKTFGSSSESFHQGKNEEKEEEDGSPDVSFSSGPIEALGKDSGSDPESSHQDFTPVRNSLKRHHKWLKERLESENKERHQLEEVAAQLAEKAERLQYELADAKEATKSRDEIISLLQAQLARMETAYTKSLEESVHCRLQLTALEQEIFHLKELCSQYEDERETRILDGADKQYAELTSKIRQLEEDREGLSKVVVRLEKENRILEKCLNQAKNEDNLEEKHRWKERSEVADGNESSRQVEGTVGAADVELENSLKLRNNQLETQINLVNEVNKQLEKRLDALIESRKLSSHEEINESILLLNKKNSELENQLKILVEELDMKKSTREGEMSVMDKLDKEKKTEVETNDPYNECTIDSLKQENNILTETINELEKELLRLKSMPNTEKVTIRLNKEDEILSEKEKTIMEEKDVVPNEIEALKNEVDILKTELDEAKKSNVNLENQMKSLKSEARFNGQQMRVAREDELAWSNLYGIKQVTGSRSNSKTYQTPGPDKDSEEFIELKVKELEEELEKAREEIIKQQIETNMRMQAVLPPLNHPSEVLELKKKILMLENEIDNGNTVKSELDKKSFELGLGLREKRKLEFELENLKSRLQREFVPLVEAEMAKMQANLPKNKLAESNTGTSTANGDLKQRCEVLALERQRAENLQRHLGQHSNSWEGERELQEFEPSCSSFSRVKAEIPIQTSSEELDDRAKEELNQLLDNTFKRYSLDLAEEDETVPLKIELLKKKYLC